MKTIVTMVFLIALAPAYAYAFEWADMTKAEVLAPVLAILLGISELLGAINIVKPNGVIQAVIDVVASLIRKMLPK